MNHASALVSTLERMHERLCRIEMAAGRGLNQPDLKTSGLKNSHVRARDSNQISNLERSIAHKINEKTIDFISKEHQLSRQGCVDEIKDIIRPELRYISGPRLKGELVSIFVGNQWARGDRITHKYVGIIWDALKELGLWGTESGTPGIRHRSGA